MPLWSNEDWRAHIGSSWSALGRMFNTRFTRNRGKSRRDLTPHQAATMVIIVTLFIASNLVVQATQGRCQQAISTFLFGDIITDLYLLRLGLILSLTLPLLKSSMKVMNDHWPLAVKTSLSHFCVDLNHCLWFIGSIMTRFVVSPVLFLVNYLTAQTLGRIAKHLTKWTLYSNERANGSLMWSFVIVLIATIQLCVTAVVARAIIFFQLLNSGDVEENPGPRQTECFFQTESSCHSSGVEFLKLRSGLYLLKSQILNLLKLARNSKTVLFDYCCLSKGTHSLRTTAKGLLILIMLLLQAQSFDQTSFLWRCGDIESNPGPGLHPDLDYDNVNNTTVLTEDDLDDVYQEVVDIQNTYYQFGMKLGLPPRELDTIEMEHERNVARRFIKVLHVWLKQRYNVDKYGPPTWRRIVEAVDSPAGGGNHVLAKAIASRYPAGSGLVSQSTVHRPKSPQRSVGQQSHLLQHINRWRKMLIDCYLAQERSVDVWPPRKIVEFIQLNLVQQDQESDHMGLQTVQKDIDEIYGKKINTDIKDIFRHVASGSRILFEGRPGSGKTTLMLRICCDWGRGEILSSSSKLIIFVRLRHLPRTEDVDLPDLLQVACKGLSPNDVQDFSSYIEECLGENIVFILDGFDEYPPGAYDDNYISKLVSKTIFPQSIVVLSSRPAATQCFREDATKWVEVVGFMKNQVLQYVNSYFEKNKEKSKTVIKHLEEHQNVMNICYLPLHCAMLIHIYKVDGTLPKTESEFYRDFTLSHIIRWIRKQTGSTRVSVRSFNCLSGREKDAFQQICKLAFETTAASRQVFTESEVQNISTSDSLGYDKDSLGLLVIDRYFSKSGIDLTYTFLHLTLQEYLAALFMAGLSEDERISTVCTYCHLKRLSISCRYLFGMLDYSKESTVDLLKQIVDKTPDNHLLHVQCAYESQHSDAFTDIVRFHEEGFKFQDIRNPSDLFYIAYVLKAAQFSLINLHFCQCEFNDENAVALFNGIGDRELSLTIELTAKSLLSALNLVVVPGLIELELWYTKCPMAVLKGIKCYTKLTKLVLKECYIDERGDQVLGESLQRAIERLSINNLVNRQTLDIEIIKCNLNKEVALHLLQAVCDSQLSLTVEGSNDVQSLFDAFRHFTVPCLIELALYGSGSESLNMENNLKYSTKLQKLRLWRIDVFNCGLEKGFEHWLNLIELEIVDTSCPTTVLQAIKHCTNLEKLVLSKCDIDVSGAEVLGESLKHVSKLTTIDLGGNSLGGDGLSALCTAIDSYRKLRELRLRNCQIVDASAAEVLGNFLQHTSKLRSLLLSDNDLGYDGLNALSAGIMSCKELKRLDLENTNLSDRSVTYLTEWIQVFDHLESLNIWFNHFTPRGSNEIEEAVSERNKREGVTQVKALIFN